MSDNGSILSDLEIDDRTGDDSASHAASKIASAENKAVKRIRVLVATVLISVAACASLMVWFSFHGNEVETFETEFLHIAGKIIDAVSLHSQQRLGVLEAFSSTVTSHAVATGASFPFVTLPDFERRAAFTQDISQTIALLTIYFVSAAERERWGNYTLSNSGWVLEGLRFQAGDDINLINQINELAQNGSLRGLPQVHDFVANQTFQGIVPPPKDDLTM